MELNKTKKWFYLGSILSVIFIFVLGSWWLYLVFKLASKLDELNIPEIKGNLFLMVQWEGITFIFLLFMLTIALVYMFYLDNKKTRAISAFFASLGHELKTPLASIRLQSQVIADICSDSSIAPNVEKYISRLKQDTIRLENELEKSLQLSRIELGGNLNLVEINYPAFIRKISKDYPITLKLTSEENEVVLADELALQTIYKNLFENSIRHNSKNEALVVITIKKNNGYITANYQDNAQFKGEIKRLAQLFYKHNSPGGSGVGLYLISKLLKKMQGKLRIDQLGNGLIFEITLPRGSEL